MKLGQNLVIGDIVYRYSKPDEIPFTPEDVEKIVGVYVVACGENSEFLALLRVDVRDSCGGGQKIESALQYPESVDEAVQQVAALWRREAANRIRAADFVSPSA